MQCPKCGAPVNPGQKFCTECGQPMANPQSNANTSNTNQSVCPKCGAPVNPGQKFCTKCDQPMATASQQNNKGFIDNVTHLGTFMERGSRGVQAEIRKEEQQRLQQQAQAMGLEVVKPQNGQQTQLSQPQVQEQPQERRLVIDTDSVEGVNIVSGRAIWDIQKGQIARLVTETEFANAAGLKGVIVQEGCTAMVFIDGKMMTMMQAGCYTFPAKTEAELQLEQRQKQLETEQKELEKQQKAIEDEQRRKDNEYAQTFAARGVFGEVAAFGQGVMNFLFGKKKGDSLEQHKKKQEQKVEKLRLNPSPKICRVYIISNRIINLLFGSQTNADGAVDFAPMLIPTKVVDVNVAVSMQLQISNMNLFVANYLADKKSVSVLDIQNELTPSVKALLTQMLRNLDYQAEGLPEPIVNNLKNRLQASCNERMQGIEVVRVMDITDSSADFERFRAVERELFASEKELGFLQRTNEFRNRLEQEQNKRTVDAAGNAEQLRQSLQAINKDKLLSEDEMEQFVMLLESQKRIRIANVQKEESIAIEEVRQALIDMKKTGLVKDDELAALEHSLLQKRIDREDSTEALENAIEQRRIERENITQIMRIQALQKISLSKQIAEFELSDNKLEHDMANALRQAQHQGNLTAIQLDNKRLLDAYNDERNDFDWNQAFSRRKQEDDYKFQQSAYQDEYIFNKAERERNADFQNRVKNENFDWEKQQRNAQMRREDEDRQRFFDRQNKFDDIDILERKAAIARQNMQGMQEQKLRELQEMNRFAESQLQEANRSTENIHSMDVQERMHKASMERQMSAEQLREIHRQNLSEAAQIASFNIEGVKEQANFYKAREEEARKLQEEERKRSDQRETYARSLRAEDMDRMERMQRNSSADLKEMMKEMMGTVRDINANNAHSMSEQYTQQMKNQQQMNNIQQEHMQQRYRDQVARAEEYKQDAYHQQARMDHTQNQALDMTGNIAKSVASNVGTQRSDINVLQNINQPQSLEENIPLHAMVRTCQACGAEVPEGELFCGECGNRM